MQIPEEKKIRIGMIRTEMNDCQRKEQEKQDK